MHAKEGALGARIKIIHLQLGLLRGFAPGALGRHRVDLLAVVHLVLDNEVLHTGLAHKCKLLK